MLIRIQETSFAHRLFNTDTASDGMPRRFTHAMLSLTIGFIAFDFVAANLLNQKEADEILQINLSISSASFLRRERDSNPRYLSVQRFSRPPRSTTLPSLQNFHREVLSFKSDAKVRLIFESARVWTIFFHLNLFFLSKQLLTLFNICSIIGMYKFPIFS